MGQGPVLAAARLMSEEDIAVPVAMDSSERELQLR